MAIIDRKFPKSDGKSSFSDIALLSPDEDLEDFVDCITVICLNNGMRHREIAKYLFAKGINKIIYLPMDELTAKNDARILRKAFFAVLEGEFGQVVDIPFYREKDGDIISETEDRVIFWCDIKYVYTFSPEIVEYRTEGHLAEKKDLLLKYSDMPLSEYTPYVNLFAYLSGKEADIEEYLEMQRSNKRDKEKLIIDRKRLFDVYEYWQKFDTDFFSSCPTAVVYNEKFNRFNIEDGLHRASYLIHKGYKKVPVAVNRKAHDCFVAKLQWSKADGE